MVRQPVQAPRGPSLRDLLEHPRLQLRLISDDLPETALDRAARWVHSSDLLDPTPFLADDLVLLTTGSQFTQRTPVQQREYISRLARRGITALGFGTDVTLPGTPEPVQQACADAHIPLFEVPYSTPFIAVARAHAELISKAQRPGAVAVDGQQRHRYAQLLTLLLLDDPALADSILNGLARARPAPPPGDDSTGDVRAMLRSEQARTLAAARLAPIRRSDRDLGTDLERSLRVWIQHGAHHEPAAKELGIHRHTLRSRVAQASKLLGLDLASFNGRAQLWMLLQSARS